MRTLGRSPIEHLQHVRQEVIAGAGNLDRLAFEESLLSTADLQETVLLRVEALREAGAIQGSFTAQDSGPDTRVGNFSAFRDPH